MLTPSWPHPAENPIARFAIASSRRTALCAGFCAGLQASPAFCMPPSVSPGSTRYTTLVAGRYASAVSLACKPRPRRLEQTLLSPPLSLSLPLSASPCLAATPRPGTTPTELHLPGNAAVGHGQAPRRRPGASLVPSPVCRPFPLQMARPAVASGRGAMSGLPLHWRIPVSFASAALFSTSHVGSLPLVPENPPPRLFSPPPPEKKSTWNSVPLPAKPSPANRFLLYSSCQPCAPSLFCRVAAPDACRGLRAALQLGIGRLDLTSMLLAADVPISPERLTDDDALREPPSGAHPSHPPAVNCP
ncbi:hypothetical protein CDD83_8653 [Cordyceps sp. RAO-2017]|nr:hypothetical protein CDD83_8653 [Cordyceps sp. RAO-2017]